MDARTGYEGTIHNSLGDADAVDGLFYENNMLYLTAKGVIVSNGVEIKGGSAAVLPPQHIRFLFSTYLKAAY